MTSTPPGQPSEELLATVDRATSRLLATVERLDDPDWHADTVLPGWTRAHVVAHLALNAEGLAGVLDGLAEEERAPMYVSDERRDAEIDELAGAEPVTLRERLRAGAAAFADAVRRVPESGWRGTFDRLPSGPTMPAGALPGMRHREVQIHHADLGAGFSHRDWPADFVADLLDTVAVDHAGSGPFRVTASDLGRSWQIAEDSDRTGPEVIGTGSELCWWLAGREISSGLRCDTGELPAIGPWRRSPPRKG